MICPHPDITEDVPKFPKTKFQISPKVTWRINTQTYYKCSPLNNQRSGLIYNDSHKPSIFVYDWVNVVIFFFKCTSPGYHSKKFLCHRQSTKDVWNWESFFFFFLFLKFKMYWSVSYKTLNTMSCTNPSSPILSTKILQAFPHTAQTPL